MKQLLILTVTLILTACKPSSSDIHGQYIGKYGGAVETLTLRTNGSYTQTLNKGDQTLYANAGNWTLNSNAEKLSLTDFIVAVDLSNAQLIKNSLLLTLKPDKSAYFDFSYYHSDGKVFLIGATKTLYYLEKVKRENEVR